MNETKCSTPDERYVYNERLAQLDVLDRKPTPEEHQQAMQDVKKYRLRVTEMVGMLG